MDSQFHEILESFRMLIKALTGIVVSFFVIFIIALLLPLMFQAVGESEFVTLSESIGEKFIGAMGGFIWAFVGLISVICLIWTITVFLPVRAQIQSLKRIKTGNEALDTLKLHYAKGEITKRQYIQRKKILEEEE